MAEHTFRKAEESDIESLVAIEYELFPENNFNERTLQRHFSTGLGYLIHVDSELAAYVLVAGIHTPLLDVIRLGVREPFRRAGLASVLLDNVLRLGSDAMLTVRKNNTPAIKLYQKFEFDIVGMMPQHDSWIMRRSTKTAS